MSREQEELLAWLAAVQDDPLPQDDPEESAWESLVEGTIDEAERARLSEAHGPLVDAVEDPLDEAYAARTTARLMALRPAEPAPLQVAAGEPAPALGGRRPWWTKLLPMAGLVLAVALVAPRFTVDEVAELPRYSVEALGGDAVDRSAPAAAGLAPMSAGSSFAILLRPEQTLQRELDLRPVVGFVGPDGVQPVPVQVHAAGSGALRLRGTVGSAWADSGDEAVLKVWLVPGTEQATGTADAPLAVSAELLARPAYEVRLPLVQP